MICSIPIAVQAGPDTEDNCLLSFTQIKQATGIW